MYDGPLPFGGAAPVPAQREIFDASQRVDPLGPRTFEASVAMRDGTELAASVYLPAASELPVPAVVLGTPYGKDEWAEPDVARWRAAGYAHIRFDTRGRGKSEGIWHPFTLADGEDGHDIVEWVAAQTWCTGAIGMEGLSYDGWVAMATVSQRPPHLRAAIPISAAGRWQQEIPYTHGCFQLYFVWWWAMMRRRIMDYNVDASALFEVRPLKRVGEILGLSGPGWDEWMSHDSLDDLWRGRRWDGAYDFDVPLLHITGWHDREDIQAAFHHYEQMVEHSPARDRQWLLVGPWSHTSSRYPTDKYDGVNFPGGNLDMEQVQRRFFDYFLKGTNSGVDREPRVQIYDTGRKRWEIRSSWADETRSFALHLTDTSTLSSERVGEGSRSYRYDPLSPNGIKLDLRAPLLEPTLDLGELEAQPGVVSWTSESFAEPVTIRGWGEVTLWCSTDCDDTEWHVKLADVHPDGSSICIGWGCLRASHHNDLGTPEPVTPGVVQRYSVEMTPMFHTVMSGHRIRLVVASSEYPWFAANLNSSAPIGDQSVVHVAHNEIFYSQLHDSCVHLQVEY